MEKKTYQQILNEVCVSNGFTGGWFHACNSSGSSSESTLILSHKAAELYANQEKKAYARVAVLKDRKKLNKRYEAYFLDDELKNLPIELP